MKDTAAPNSLRFDLADTDLDAPAVEALIRKLAQARATMRPPVPHTWHEAAAADAQALRETSPSATFATLANGGLRIRLRSAGLGWLAFDLPPADVDGLRDLLTREFPHVDRPH